MGSVLQPGIGGINEPPFVEVGEFRQGSPVSRWALARYLVGQALAESVSRALLLVGLLVLALAAAIGFGLSSPFWAIVTALVGIAVLGMRTVLRTVLRAIRLAPSGPGTALDARMRALVADTRADVLAELRRAGLPGRTWSLPWLGYELVSRHRREGALARLRAFDVDRVVPAARLDELHLLLQSPPERF